MREYAAALREFVPEVHKLAIEGVSLGLEAINLAQTGLSGKAPEPALLARQQALKNELLQARNINTLDANSFPFALDKHHEEQLVDEFASAAWALSTLALKESLLGIFNSERAQMLEARTDAMQAQLDSTIDSRSVALESRADALCDTAQRLDALEQKLGLFDLFQARSPEHADDSHQDTEPETTSL